MAKYRRPEGRSPAASGTNLAQRWAPPFFNYLSISILAHENPRSGTLLRNRTAQQTLGPPSSRFAIGAGRWWAVPSGQGMGLPDAHSPLPVISWFPPPSVSSPVSFHLSYLFVESSPGSPVRLNGEGPLPSMPCHGGSDCKLPRQNIC